MIRYLLSIVILIGLPIIINVGSEMGNLGWVKDHIRECWTVMFILVTLWSFYSNNKIIGYIKRAHAMIPIIQGYVICFFIGGLILSIVWGVTGKMFPVQEIKPKNATDNKQVEIPSLRKLFDKDFNNILRVSSKRMFDIEDKQTKKIKKISFTERMYLDFSSRSKFLGYYIPSSFYAYDLIRIFSDIYTETIKHFDSGAKVKAWYRSDLTQTSQKELVFSGRIYIYHEDMLSLQQLAELERIYKSKNLSVIFRGHSYLISEWPKK